jgi:hypothetical protein
MNDAKKKIKNLRKIKNKKHESKENKIRKETNKIKIK